MQAADEIRQQVQPVREKGTEENSGADFGARVLEEEGRSWRGVVMRSDARQAGVLFAVPVYLTQHDVTK